MANSLLKITNITILQQFLHDCVDDLIKYRNVNFDSYSSDIEWTNEDYKAAITFVQNLYREITISNKKHSFSKIQELGPESQQCITDCYEIRKNDILQAVVRESVSKTGLLVENIDWKLKWVIGSSKLANLKQPLLQIDLHCFKKENEDTRRTINFEMSLEQVEQFISCLQLVKNELKE